MHHWAFTTASQLSDTMGLSLVPLLHWLLLTATICCPCDASLSALSKSVIDQYDRRAFYSAAAARTPKLVSDPVVQAAAEVRPMLTAGYWYL